MPVVWVELSDADEKALNVTLNNPHVAGEFVDEQLAAILEGLRTEMPRLEWDELLLSGLVESNRVGANPDNDDAPPLDRGPAQSVLGQVYDLGPHRLVCGDSRSLEVVRAVMGDRLADVVFTDPPYGVAYKGQTTGLTIENDDLDEDALGELLRAAFVVAMSVCRPGAAWYVAAPAGPLFQVFSVPLKELKIWRQTICWVKDALVLGRSDYHYRHEAIFYGWLPNAPHQRHRLKSRTEDTVWEVPRPRRSVEHPTMKPVELVERAIVNSSHEGDVILDFFAGSGSTLIAAAAQGRVARCVELDPHYADVIRRRWTTWARDHGQEPGPGALEASKERPKAKAAS